MRVPYSPPYPFTVGLVTDGEGLREGLRMSVPYSPPYLDTVGKASSRTVGEGIREGRRVSGPYSSPYPFTVGMGIDGEDMREGRRMSGPYSPLSLVTVIASIPIFSCSIVSAKLSALPWVPT